MKTIAFNIYSLLVRVLLVLIFAVSLVVIFAWDTEGTVERFTIILTFKLIAFFLMAWSYMKLADLGVLKWLSK